MHQNHALEKSWWQIFWKPLLQVVIFRLQICLAIHDSEHFTPTSKRCWSWCTLRKRNIRTSDHDTVGSSTLRPHYKEKMAMEKIWLHILEHWSIGITKIFISESRSLAKWHNLKTNFPQSEYWSKDEAKPPMPLPSHTLWNSQIDVFNHLSHS